MPRKKWIDKKNATHYSLLFRSQQDPLLNDETAGERALFQTSGLASSSRYASNNEGLHISDLEDDIDFESMRENEGEAAEYGIYYDDTNYDYMQHLREIGEGSGDAHFVDSAPVKVHGKGKAKMMKLEDVLKEASLEDDHSPSIQGGSVLDDSFSTFSRSTRPRTYQNQQDVPDEIAGFQPDMDPRLREVLEALEDDAYVDEKDEGDIFGALARDGRGGELDLYEYEVTGFEDDGWESDVTEKASEQPKELKLPQLHEKVGDDTEPESKEEGSTTDPAVASAEDGDWLRDFAKFKRDAARKPPPKGADSIIAGSAVNDRAPTLYTLNGTLLRQKKRKGALTNPSAYSMTSSSLVRTEGQQLLDARFDQIEKMYALNEAEEFDDDEDGGMSLASGMSKQSKMSAFSTASFADEGAVRKDFDGMMDGFLDGWNNTNPGGGNAKRRGPKAKRGKHGNELIGLKQLDEVRSELGPARIYKAQKV